MSTVVFNQAREAFADYITNPERYWDESPGEIQKIVRALAAIEARDGSARDAVIESVLAAAERRASGHLPTVYVGGRGGSGSHWLAEMLHDLGSFANAREVAVPRALRNVIMRWPPAERAMLVDAIHLFHALPERPEAERCSLVNSRGSVHFITFKRWDPSCLFVHLIRDPREQCMSVTYRKPTAREVNRTQADADSDHDFLRRMIYLNRASTLRTIGSPIEPDHVVRYEELREDPRTALTAIASAAGIEVAPSDLDRVAFEHRAENIQAGLTPSKGNLSQGGSRGWQETSSQRQRQFLHAGLSDVVDLTNYPLDDCLGAPAELAVISEEITISFPTGVLLGELYGRTDDDATWQHLGAAAGEVTIPAGTAIRLRCPGGWTSHLSHLAHLPDDSLSSLCLVGNRDVRDEDLTALIRLRSLRELDLSRTPITDAALAHLSRLPQLRGLAVLECALTASALAEFARQRPGCQLVAGKLWSEHWRAEGRLEERFIP
jgi:Sulfotransferase domain